jgi:hypothetical protein
MSKIYLLLIFTIALSIFTSTSTKNNKWKLKILPNKEYEIENPFPFIFEEKCIFKFTDPQDKISIKILKGKAFTNSEELSKTELNIIDNKNQKKWKGKISLETYSTIIIKNLGENEIKVKCELSETKKLIDSQIELFELYKKNNFKISEDIDLTPNKPYTINNPLIFAVSVNCKVSCAAPEEIFGEVKKGSASVNGNDITSKGLTLTVNNGENFDIHASKYASATLTNKGKDVVHAKCSLGMNELLNEEYEEKYNQFLESKKILDTHEAFFNEYENNENENNEKFDSLKFLA